MHSPRDVGVLIAAAGMGVRVGGSEPKQFRRIAVIAVAARKPTGKVLAGGRCELKFRRPPAGGRPHLVGCRDTRGLARTDAAGRQNPEHGNSRPAQSGSENSVFSERSRRVPDCH